jgi:quercetin dioxygenase-like cupin family protein
MNTNVFRPIKLGKEVFYPKSYDENSFVMDWTVEAGGKVPPHVHFHMDEHFIITHGEITFQVNSEKILKKAGEEFFVPKGIVHSVTNTNKDQSAMTVTYSPCADTHRMFQILSILEEENPGSATNMMKYFYLAPRLGLKEFSTVSPPFLMNFLNGVVTIIGKLFGWNKWINQFKWTKSEVTAKF